MASREITLQEEFDSLVKNQCIDMATYDRLTRKLKKEHVIYDQCRQWQQESDAKCAVLEHDNHIQEQIILQLNYEKYKNVIDEK